MKHLLFIMFLCLLAGCNASPADESGQTKNSLESSNVEQPEKGQEETDSVVETETESEEGETEQEKPEPPAEPKLTYTINQTNWTMETEAKDHQKAVLLTIDDAPDTYGLEMAKKLKEWDVPAIFFINGHFIDTDEEKEVLRKIHELGFPIGNHTMTHANLSNLSVEEQKEEILPLNKQIEEIIGEKPQFFRAPFGVNTDFSIKMAEEQNMMYMNWTFGYDWVAEYQDSKALADIMVNTDLLMDGAIILAHDREWTNEALKEIVDGLRAKGYTFIDPDQIVKK
jgi:peptidoglycan/xylan/chitin deacetylase (PgdA/CDA1 family)